MTSSSGSENRQRKIIHPVRMNETEYSLLRQQADHFGISLGRLMRDVPLGRRFHTRERKKVMADLGRLGGLFKLAITKDYLVGYRSDFQHLLSLLQNTIEKIARGDDFKGDLS
jgi:hypothetical protein